MECRIIEDVRYFVDEPTGQPRICDHGVVEVEVEFVLRKPVEDRAARGDSRSASGQTEAGRYLQLIYGLDPGGKSAFVVTAYEIRGKRLRAFRRRRRRRKK